MSTSIQLAEWLGFIEQEYLGSYIRDGGAAIKFVIPLSTSSRSSVIDAIQRKATEAGYLVASVDCATTKLHMMDEIFFRVAAQVPWQQLSLKIIAKLAVEAGYSWGVDGSGPLYQRLASENQVDPQLLLLDLKKAIGNKLFLHLNLPHDFRVAMMQLCMAELAGGQDGASTIQLLTDWLTGRNKAVSAVKPFQIFRRINRNNARFLFESMLHWVRLAGYPGVVVVIDAERLMLARNPAIEGLFYSKAALLDAYEVLREFIDALDRLEGCFLTVVPDSTFLEDLGRGISSYQALKFRVYDEIRDRSLVNPMASLARISAPAQGNRA
jgi:hypothetical protein